MAAASERDVHIHIESNFAKKLASNEGITRKKALKSLKNWIRNNSKPGRGFNEDQLLRFWKGLFYTMWMSDKALNQEKLAADLVTFISIFDSFDDVLKFTDAFFKTMSREWFSIDRFRIEKFMMLVRHYLRQLFATILLQDKKVISIKKTNEILKRTVLNHEDNSSCPVSLATHVIDIYLDELKFTANGNLKPKMIQRFLEPFCDILAYSKRSTILTTVRKSVFEAIMDESAYHLNEINGDVDDDEDDEDELEYLKIKHANIHLHDMNQLEPIHYDCALIAKMLMNRAKKQQVRTKNRKICYSIINKLKAVEDGHDPLVTQLHIDSHTPQDVDHSIKQLMVDIQQDSSIKSQWRLDRLQTKRSKKRPLQTDQNQPSSPKKKKKKKIVVEDDAPEEIVKCNSAEEQKGVEKAPQDKKLKRYFNQPMIKTAADVADNNVVEGEIEIIIPNKKYKGKLKMEEEEKSEQFAKFEKITKTPPAFVKKSLQKARSASLPAKKKIKAKLNSTMSVTPRRVNFVLEKNSAHEHKDYTNAIKNSPVPYDASKRPSQGVLKRT